MAAFTMLLVLMAATVVLAPLAERWSLPYPAVLLAFGLLLAFVPGIPVPTPPPELILPLVLPPLLFAAARRTSWREFLDNRRPIMLLAVALVAVTAFAVGATLHALVPTVPLIAAIALGAAVAPPDPIAATAVARKLGIPRRLRTILEGEGLSNDATALVLYEVAVAATLTGAVSPLGTAKAFGLAVVLGVLIGLVIAAAARFLVTRLPAHPAGSALVLVVPFVAYAAADAAHGSGVLAVVTVALALSRYGDAESSKTRLVTGTTWEIVELLVTGAAFAFVGLELRAVAMSIDAPLSGLIRDALVITLVVIVIRFLWIFPVAGIDERLHRRKSHIAEPIGWREMTVSSWAGMRGVVTLAAVLALPPEFPERDRLVFFAFVVIVVTLLLQGLTLPTLVRRLGVRADDGEHDDAFQELLRRAREAGFTRLDELADRDGADAEAIDRARDNADRMWQAMGYEPADSPGDQGEHAGRVNDLKDEMLSAARDAVVAARSESGIDPTVVDLVLRRLDARGRQPE
ncbi:MULTISPECIES: Na+/H+ antiporter [Mycobacteriaceae]|uniref:Na+/H+ antiporter n=1 Tax=Mycobacteriaceae TaxID=1762 RepID=UPI000B0DF10D|nr:MULTISPECIES: Na+/H+ antiporter [Mycobacteriaceae]MCK0177060.1 Na+/H+ antiporter [Mycolicibacterium sp. F2034L]